MEIEFRRKPEIVTRFSRDMRKSMTFAEKLFRGRVKGKQVQGRKFHRQKPLFVYREEGGKDKRVIADFYHHPSKVVIEIDGSIHDLADVQVRDRRRTELLEQRGFVVVRYTNDDVIYNLDMVMTELQQRIGERLEQKNAGTMDTND